MGANDDGDSGELPDYGDNGGAGSDRGRDAGSEQGPKPNAELSIEDVRFLRAVRDINENPEDYPRTKKGTMAASTRAIREATTLSKNQIDYRLGTTTKERGFDDLGYLVIHDPPMTDTGYGPRSAELTGKGEQRLEEGLQAYGLEETEARADPEVMEKLEDVGARLDDLERQLAEMEDELNEVGNSINNLEGRVSQIETNQMGAVNGEQAARLRTVIDAMPAFYQAFQLMGMDVREIQESEDLDEREAKALMEDVRATLNR